MFKKTLLAVCLAFGLASTASAGDAIANGTFQLDVGTLQTNVIAELNAISVGNTVFDQTNVVNSSNVVIDTGASGDAILNGAAQISLGNVQGNAILTLGGVNLGDTQIDQLNAVNVAAVDIDVWDDAIFNGVPQVALGTIQGNLVAMGELVSLGNTTIAQSNFLNSATLDIDIDSFDSGGPDGIEVAFGNGISQLSAFNFQGNLALIADGLSAGNLTVDQVNAMNVAALTITDSEAAVFNGVTQVSGTVIQGNGLFVAQGANLGNLDVAQTNVANSADVVFTMERDGGGTSLAAFNGILQDAETAGTVDQDNIVSSLQGIGIGNTIIDQINAVNVASMDMSSTAGTTVAYTGNDILQLAQGGLVDQDNAIALGSVLNIGNVDITQTNVVNSADMSLTGALVSIGNNVTQLASGITQSNITTMAAFGSVGNVNVSQVNAINVASLVITP